jgi:hypothetical protein
MNLTILATLPLALAIAAIPIAAILSALVRP